MPPTARSLIESGALAHLVTLNRDGSPQVSCVWVGIEGDELVTAHLRQQQKLRNVRRDPRVALSLEGTEVQPPGLTQYLVVHGRARIDEGGAPRAAPAARARLPRPRRAVSADAGPAAGLRDADCDRTLGRHRPLGRVTQLVRRDPVSAVATPSVTNTVPLTYRWRRSQRRLARTSCDAVPASKP